MLKRYLKKGAARPKKDSVPPPRSVFIKHDDMILPGNENVVKQKRSRA
jgi:hypothetical protein